VLRKELRASGATAQEAGQLSRLAHDLRLLRQEGQDANDKNLLPLTLRRLIVPSLYIVLGVITGVFVLSSAQAALPNSWLFPVQKFSDNLTVRLYPQYRETIMMKRADQVNELVARRASDRATLDALADYTEIAAEYKSAPHANYAAFRYCKSRLMQAANGANPEVGRAIRGSLESLDTT